MAAFGSAAVSVREFSPPPAAVSSAASSAAHPDGSGPVVWVAKASPPPALLAAAARRGTDAENAENATTSLALASLSAQELDELRAGLDLLGSRLEASANPFVDDLEDGPPGEEMAAVRRSLAPALTAAHHLAARTQTSADGTFAIAFGASCAEAPVDATCFPLWGAGAATGASGTKAQLELRERASFFAWPIASAAVVRFSDATRAAEVLDVLGDRARSPSSRISLALDERALAGEADPRAEAVRGAARNVFAHANRNKSTPELDALRPLAARPAPGRRVPWLTLDAGEIMVVPKLGALSDLAAFARELDELMTARGLDREARWVRRPTPSR